MTVTSHFSDYSDAIRSIDLSKLTNALTIPRNLDMDRDGQMSIHYIPFDYINPKAKVVLVGITPGFTQLYNALEEAKKQLLSGKDDESVLMAAKKTGAFSGTLRKNLVAMLDHVELNKWVGIKSCDTLFSNDSDLVQTTSVLRYPVFVEGENYSGKPIMTKHPLLQRYLKRYFSEEAQTLNDAIFIPLGPVATEALHYLVKQSLLDGKRVIEGLPHPSGANNERIAYFIGKTPANALSKKTNPAILDNAKRGFIQKLNSI